MVTVYSITMTGENFAYVGASASFKKRIAQHKDLLKRGKHPNSRLTAALAGRSVDSLVFTALESCSTQDAPIVEARHIVEHAARYSLLNIYPATTCGRRGRKHTAETKAKLSQMARERLADPVARAKAQACMRASAKTTPHSAHRREQVRQLALKGSKPVKNMTTGVTYPSCSAAARAEKISQGTISIAMRKGTRAGGHLWSPVNQTETVPSIATACTAP